jgi:hypothetical protein
MKNLAHLLLVAAILNMGNKCLELQKLGLTSWPWLIATFAAVLVVEIADHLSKANRSGRDLSHLGGLFWAARLALILTLACLHINGVVSVAATDEVHRSAVGEAIIQESTAITAIEAARLISNSPRREVDREAIARGALLAVSLREVESIQDIQALASRLDSHPANLLSECAPMDGYSEIVATTVRIPFEVYIKEWLIHSGALVGQLILLLIPYGIGAVAGRYIDSCKHKSDATQTRNRNAQNLTNHPSQNHHAFPTSPEIRRLSSDQAKT